MSNFVVVSARRLGALCLAACCVACASSGSQLAVTLPQEHLDADLIVDGQYVGTLSELTAQKAGLVRLAPGQHRVEVRKAGYFPYQRAVRVPRRRAPHTIKVAAELYLDP